MVPNQDVVKFQGKAVNVQMQKGTQKTIEKEIGFKD